MAPLAYLASGPERSWGRTPKLEGNRIGGGLEVSQFGEHLAASQVRSTRYAGDAIATGGDARVSQAAAEFAKGMVQKRGRLADRPPAPPPVELNIGLAGRLTWIFSFGVVVTTVCSFRPAWEFA